MPIIETQGLSEDYSIATGSFDVTKRGEVTKSELFEILKKLSQLTTPTQGDDCPPSVNTSFGDDYYSCFFGDGDCIRCTDSQHEVMSPEEALDIMCGEMSLAEFDALKGHAAETAKEFATVVKPRAKKGKRQLVVLAIVAVIVTAVVFSS